LTDAKLDGELRNRCEGVVELLDVGLGDDYAGLPVTRTRHLHCPVCEELCTRHTDDNLSVCTACSHIFQTDLAVTIRYDARYAHQYDSLPVREMSDVRWDFIQSHLALPAGRRILDVGYGNGAFLKRAREAGMCIHGIDVHSEDFGIPNVDFDTKLEFDLACFFDSIEHFPVFDPIFKLKAKVAIVSIPNTPVSLLASPKTWRHFKPGEHLHYFSRTSLDKLMLRWGFTHKLTEGFPEDQLRGKLVIDGMSADNIYTAIYRRGKAPFA
jgi:hypothetical protein